MAFAADHQIAVTLLDQPGEVLLAGDPGIAQKGPVRLGNAAFSSGWESRPGNREPRARYRALPWGW
jgi:hypothetical protein